MFYLDNFCFYLLFCIMVFVLYLCFYHFIISSFPYISVLFLINGIFSERNGQQNYIEIEIY